MDKKLFISQIAENTYCSIKDFKDICIHEIRHCGLNPNDFNDAIAEFINDKKRLEK